MKVRYKVLLRGRRTPSPSARKHLPRWPQIGVWTPRIPKDKLKLCRRGYHFTTKRDLHEWIIAYADTSDVSVYEIQTSKHCRWGSEKGVTTSAKLIRLLFHIPRRAFGVYGYDDRGWRTDLEIKINALPDVRRRRR